VVQSTLVLVIPPSERDALRGRLESGDFEHKSVPHALFSVKGEGVVATLYSSGKFVIQGENPDLFAQRYAGDRATPAKRAAVRDAPGIAIDGPLVGSDECGKGDYFGPLIVVGVRVEAGDRMKLRAGGVRDSKELSDDTSLRLGAALRGQFPHAIARLDPPLYNATWRRPGQLNEMLADLHLEVIRKLARPGIHVLVDQFADAKVMAKRVAGMDIHLEQRTRAESEPAVAAASIIAREEYLLALRALSEEFGVDLHKGAGPPTDRAAERFVLLHGREALSRVAKVHFKNTQRIRAGSPPVS
jgi:ribonuclease HIII